MADASFFNSLGICGHEVSVLQWKFENTAQTTKVKERTVNKSRQMSYFLRPENWDS
jgi:hypothetical protein